MSLIKGQGRLRVYAEGLRGSGLVGLRSRVYGVHLAVFGLGRVWGAKHAGLCIFLRLVEDMPSAS